MDEEECIKLRRENFELKQKIEKMEKVIASSDPDWETYCELKRKFRGL